jgi:hypothetical protein
MPIFSTSSRLWICAVAVAGLGYGSSLARPRAQDTCLELLVDLILHRQAMRVPAEAAAHVVAVLRSRAREVTAGCMRHTTMAASNSEGHLVPVARDDILDGAREDVAVMRQTCAVSSPTSLFSEPRMLATGRVPKASLRMRDPRGPRERATHRWRTVARRRTCTRAASPPATASARSGTPAQAHPHHIQQTRQGALPARVWRQLRCSGGAVSRASALTSIFFQ